MVYIHTRRYKETSHQPIEKIREQQHKHKKDIVQPRIEGEINPEFIRQHGARNLNISQHDIRKIARKGGVKMERYLTETFKRQQKGDANQDK